MAILKSVLTLSFAIATVFSFAQNGTYEVSIEEFEQLQKSLDKREEIENSGLRIVVSDKHAVIQGAGQVENTVTVEELSTYQNTPSKLNEFEASTGGNYKVVTPNQNEVPQASQELSDSDKQKLLLEEKMNVGASNAEQTQSMRNRNGSDTTTGASMDDSRGKKAVNRNITYEQLNDRKHPDETTSATNETWKEGQSVVEPISNDEFDTMPK